MQSVGLYDLLRFIPRDDGTVLLDCRWAEKFLPEPAVEKNLAYRAAVMLKELLGEKRGVEIRLIKNIPAGAGLGGSSSDAAVVLSGLCRLWKRKPGADALTALAAKLGADVAFFLKGGCCLAEGIGEIITPLKTSWDKKTLWIVLVKPAFSTSTKEIYCKLDEMRGTVDKTNRTAGRDIADRTADYERVKSGGILRFEDIDFVNDLEAPVISMHPEINEIKRRLVRHGGLGASVSMMSGSGSSVFGIFRSHSAALAAQKELKKNASFKTFLVPTIK
jgi:4-diphosphocytidyl-2-C-methyl-D-erythritol kinase